MAKNDRLEYASKCLKFAEVQKKQLDIVVDDKRCLGPGNPGMFCAMDYGFSKGGQYGGAISLNGDEDIRDICAKVTLPDFDKIPEHLDAVLAKTGLEIPDDRE